MDNGWIKLNRSIIGHWAFDDSNYLRAWIVMLIKVNWTDRKVFIDGDVIECSRGQSVMSADSWAACFGVSKRSGSWTRQKVRTFFNVLEKDGMIKVEGLRKTTRVTICNYTTYQDCQPTDNQQITNRQPTDNQQITTNEEGKERKERKERKKPLPKKAPTKDIKDAVQNTVVVKDIPVHEKFVSFFSKIYTTSTKQVFKADKVHFILSERMIRNYGIDTCVEKVKVLASMCAEGSRWPVKNGWADFTIENMSKNWNSIIKVEKMDESTIRSIRVVNNLRKQRGEDELPISTFTGTGVSPIAREVVCGTGQTAIRKQVEYIGRGDVEHGDSFYSNEEGDTGHDDA